MIHIVLIYSVCENDKYDCSYREDERKHMSSDDIIKILFKVVYEEDNL